MASFPTGGHKIYHLRPATVTAGSRAVIAAAYDGTILAYTPGGNLIWENRPADAFPFDLAAADIDGDGLDEALLACGNGFLYAVDHDGKGL